MSIAISAFMPAYNEEDNIETAVSSLIEELALFSKDYEIIIVLYEGHTDRTGDVLEKMSRKNPRIKTMIQPRGMKGYGTALRMGYENSKGTLVFYTDADNQYDPKDLRRFLKAIESCDMVIGYRKNRRDPLLRRFAAKVYNMLVNIFLGTGVKDVDCAFKLVKRAVLSKIRLESNTGMIDAELVAKAKASGFRILELPVRSLPRLKGEAVFSGAGGIVKPKIVIGLLKEMMKIRRSINEA